MHDDHSNLTQPEGSDSSQPAQIGAYKIMSTLGRGGMGTVYLAEQTAPVTRKVALKVINWGMESENIVARFHSERQALALMNHPYIATVYDAGTTPEGLPYFVMERVAGEPVLKYCDRKQLNVTERLLLFLKVCEGVQHAHQKMVIHRDLKPSNILVSERDGEAEPKLIDFGIAKTTKSGALPNDVNLTMEGTPLGTPMYMSPEQVEGQSLDARVDVYALGVLLYEILAGAPPFNSDNADYYHMLVKVMEEMPLLPSVRFAGLGEKIANISSNRQTDKKSLIKLLRGDLDWIILKAMEKDREKRYGSVTELKADIQLHIQCKPVSAKPKNLAYQIKKFMQRHKIGVAAGVALFLLLILGISGTSYGLVQAIHARNDAKVSETRALETLAYLERILASVDPSTQGRNMRIVDLLGKAVTMVEEDLNEDPYIESAIRKTIGWSYLEMGIYDLAEKELRRAFELQENLWGASHLETLATQNALGRLYYKIGKFAEAEAIHRKVFDVEKEFLGPDHETTLWTQYNLAKSLDKQGRFTEAEALYRDNISRRTRVLGPSHSHTLIANNSLALLLAFDTRGIEGEALQKRTLGILEKELGRNHPQTINAMANLVAIYSLHHEHQKAEAIALETLVLQKNILGENHPETLETQTYLAKSLIQIGNLPAGENLLERVFEAQKQTLGVSNPETIGTLGYLAKTKYLLGEFDVASDLAKQAEIAALETLGASHWITAFCRGVYGLCLVATDQWDKGETKLLSALEGYRSFQHSERKLVNKTLRENYLKQGDIKKADYYSESQKL